MKSMQIHDFQKIVWSHYDTTKRTMPWRSDTRPYYIFVSEIMLQQTQATRVIPKFEAFIRTFPDIKSVALAPFEEVLKLWVGLGYNRRAKFLWQSAQIIDRDHGGKVPQDRTQLEALPGIGPNTAGAILAYAYNQPVTYIETNIRTVYLHHFFPDQTSIDDKDILPLIESSLTHSQRRTQGSAVGEFSSRSASESYQKYDERASQKKLAKCAGLCASCNPREWYWALMDYGVYLKTTLPNPSRASKHHTKQSKFEGSTRQIRGKVLKSLLDGPRKLSEITARINDDRLDAILMDLQKESLVVVETSTIRLA